MLLVVKRGDLGAMLGHLIRQVPTLHGDEIGTGLGGRLEFGERIRAVRDGGVQAHDEEPGWP